MAADDWIATQRNVHARLSPATGERPCNPAAPSSDFAEYRKATDKLLSVVLTGKRNNTRKWFAYLVESINKWAEATGELDRVREWKGGIEIVKGGE